MNIIFDEIGQENMPKVLADLHVSQCNGPRDSLVMHDTNVHTKRFKIDSGACGNLCERLKSQNSNSQHGA